MTEHDFFALAVPPAILARLALGEAMPRESFSLWAEPEHLMKWWGPHHCSASSVSVDLREGGAWSRCILGPDGKEYWSRGHCVEISPPECIVFTFAWESDAGRSEHEMQVTIELE